MRIPRLLVFWDGQPGSEGGTGELVKKWQKNFNEPVLLMQKSTCCTPVVNSNYLLMVERQILNFVISDDPQVTCLERSRRCFLLMWRVFRD
jgi:hypothetical protein